MVVARVGNNLSGSKISIRRNDCNHQQITEPPEGEKTEQDGQNKPRLWRKRFKTSRLFSGVGGLNLLGLAPFLSFRHQISIRSKGAALRNCVLKHFAAGHRNAKLRTKRLVEIVRVIKVFAAIVLRLFHELNVNQIINHIAEI